METIEIFNINIINIRALKKELLKKFNNINALDIITFVNTLANVNNMTIDMQYYYILKISPNIYFHDNNNNNNNQKISSTFNNNKFNNVLGLTTSEMWFNKLTEIEKQNVIELSSFFNPYATA